MGIKITSSITFLGTGADSVVIGKQLRSAGGIIIQINNNQFHLNPGPGALPAAKQYEINLRENTSIFVSDTSIYNSNDINAVIDAMTYSGFDKKGVLIAAKDVISENVSDFYKNCLERYIAIEPPQKVAINEVEIQALKTTHPATSCIGFKFFAPEFTITYASTTKYSSEITEQYKNSNILVLNIPTLEKNEKGLSKEGAIKIINAARPKLVVITGFGIKMIESDPTYEAREIQKASGVQVVAAKDGMVINPVSYSAEKGQKTLKSSFK